jgi:hypothetical protein
MPDENKNEGDGEQEAPRRGAAKKAAAKKEEPRQPPISMVDASPDNPSGIEEVSEEHARQLGEFRGFGGPGASGATVAGAAVHVATQGGTKPLPVAPHEHPDPSVGAEPDDQPTSQAAALESGDAETHADNPHPVGINLLVPAV